MALHRDIKKSLLFTAYFVNGNLTCVRCNLSGKFVKHSIYFSIENQTTVGNGITTAYGVTIDFNVVSLLVFITSIIKANYKTHKQAYNDCKIAVMIMFLALPIIMVFGQTYKLIISLLGA